MTAYRSVQAYIRECRCLHGQDRFIRSSSTCTSLIDEDDSSGTIGGKIISTLDTIYTHKPGVKGEGGQETAIRIEAVETGRRESNMRHTHMH